jgi:hypothetical protein
MAYTTKEIVTLRGTLRVNGLRQPVELTATKFTRDGFPTHYGHYDVVSGPVVPDGKYEIDIPGHGTMRVRYQRGSWIAA